MQRRVRRLPSFARSNNRARGPWLAGLSPSTSASRATRPANRKYTLGCLTLYCARTSFHTLLATTQNFATYHFLCITLPLHKLIHGRQLRSRRTWLPDRSPTKLRQRKQLRAIRPATDPSRRGTFARLQRELQSGWFWLAYPSRCYVSADSA
jgi:hypothetical protein